MKYLIFLSPYFYPEDFQFNKLYFELAKKNKVIVITGIPNYRNLQNREIFTQRANNDAHKVKRGKTN